ncbi:MULTISPECIES: M1 family aminopeptidase [unclassified Cryobacterium]|uniref:M1 family aminopeptidase n=1 Tax=unclassified Cryobacterium TaxID=2649013 RepID=UPI002AB44209|nr:MULTISPECIES: M1 family aminopeptidase [unclassified Cryobacterium]MDY7528331.1 M1 family aminopeptidase [Cryobacterium sp. 10C2]MDY7544398.1 M1 family aminopeptidase [Cryobacterium sp. 5B3]MEB0004440.1 M1 family aminopeptidase [Cryobacterium sp. RTC2.1]MEB0267941.1 M1 family aminopeptidase [Cryobacterium sp. 10I5]MEB0276804.1 M1 family aminopeptidase [Cryobacterium sp. 5B3]
MVHELGHQWFGDSVTPSGWKDIWLNEGWPPTSNGCALSIKAPQRFLRSLPTRCHTWRQTTAGRPTSQTQVSTLVE